MVTRSKAAEAVEKKRQHHKLGKATGTHLPGRPLFSSFSWRQSERSPQSPRDRRAALRIGDLPDNYGTTLLADGARHEATGPTLGAARDAEPDGLPTLAADGDDTNATSDEDGHLDVVSASTDRREAIAWYQNDGNGYFVGHGLVYARNFSAGLVTDINDDGHMDVLVRAGSASWLEGNVAGRFYQRGLATLVRGPMAAGDIDGEGDPEPPLRTPPTPRNPRG